MDAKHYTDSVRDRLCREFGVAMAAIEEMGAHAETRDDYAHISMEGHNAETAHLMLNVQTRNVEHARVIRKVIGCHVMEKTLTPSGDTPSAIMDGEMGGLRVHLYGMRTHCTPIYGEVPVPALPALPARPACTEKCVVGFECGGQLYDKDGKRVPDPGEVKADGG